MTCSTHPTSFYPYHEHKITLTLKKDFMDRACAIHNFILFCSLFRGMKIKPRKYTCSICDTYSNRGLNIKLRSQKGRECFLFSISNLSIDNSNCRKHFRVETLFPEWRSALPTDILHYSHKCKINITVLATS